MVRASLLAGNRDVDGSPKALRAKSVRRVGGRTFIASLLGVATLGLFANTSAYAVGFVPPLGAAAPYAILGVSPGTSTGLSNISGDLGLALVTSTSAGASSSTESSGLLGGGLLSGAGTLAGSLLGGVNGATIVSRAAASVAEGAAASAYQAVANEAPTHVISGSALNGATLSPGVYAVSGPLELVGRLLLNARGAASPNFIFQIPSNLTTAPGARVLLGAGVQASSVLWQVGGASAFSSGTSFVGTILSNGPITLGSGSELIGRALSLTGDVNLDSDSISVPSVGAGADAAGTAVASATKLATGVAAVRGVAAATPRVDAGALGALPLAALHPLTTLTQTLTSGPTVGSPTSGSASVAVPAALPLIPLSAIGVPELEIPTVPTVGAALPSSGAVAPLTNAFFPLVGIGAGLPTSMVPTLQVTGVPSSGTSAPTSAAEAPTTGLPALPLVGLPTSSSTPLSLIGVPSFPAPTSTSAPAATPSLPLRGISLPALALPAPSGVVLPGVTAPSNSASSAPASNALPLPLSGMSLPQLSSPSSSQSLPALKLPTLTTPGVTLPRLSSGSSTTTSSSKLVHPQVKGSPSTNHLASTSHAKSSTSTASANGSKIPVGAPQTGFGGAAGASLDLALLALGAFVLALCAASFAIRTRRLQRG